MSSFGTAPLKEVWAMLDECAPGWTKKETEHHFRIMWRKHTYHSLSKGQHGKKGGAGEVKIGQIRQMARQFEIEECAKKFFSALGPLKSQDRS